MIGGYFYFGAYQPPVLILRASWGATARAHFRKAVTHAIGPAGFMPVGFNAIDAMARQEGIDGCFCCC